MSTIKGISERNLPSEISAFHLHWFFRLSDKQTITVARKGFNNERCGSNFLYILENREVRKTWYGCIMNKVSLRGRGRELKLTVTGQGYVGNYLVNKWCNVMEYINSK